MRWLLLTLLGVLPAAPAPAADPAFKPEHVAFYQKEVLPLLKANCLKCHGDDPKKLKAGFALTSRDRKSTRLNSSHSTLSRMPSSA